MRGVTAVVSGGPSSEREVSLDSGRAAYEALERLGFNAELIDFALPLSSFASRLESLAPTRIFNALHGTWGEDGRIQSAFEMMGIPYTHSGVAASATAMAKTRAKSLFACAGVTVASGRLLKGRELREGCPLPAPLVLKPDAGGSSVGVRLVLRAEEFAAAATEFADDDDVLAESYVAGRELTCAALDDESTDVIEIVPSSGFYDYRAKYSKGGLASHSSGGRSVVGARAVARGDALGSSGVGMSRGVAGGFSVERRRLRRSGSA